MMQSKEIREPVAFQCVPAETKIEKRLLDAARPHEDAIRMVVNEPAAYFNQDARDCDVHSVYLSPGWQFVDGATFYSHTDTDTLIDVLKDGCVMPAGGRDDFERLENLERQLGQLALQLDEEGLL